MHSRQKHDIFSSFLIVCPWVVFVCCLMFWSIHTLSPLKIAAYRPVICRSAGGGSPRCPAQTPDKSAIWKSVTNTSMCGRSSGAEPSSSHPPRALIASIASSPSDTEHERWARFCSFIRAHWFIQEPRTESRTAGLVFWWWWAHGNFPSSEKGWMFSSRCLRRERPSKAAHWHKHRQQLTVSKPLA